jgi:hypothetical protein
MTHDEKTVFQVPGTIPLPRWRWPCCRWPARPQPSRASARRDPVGTIQDLSGPLAGYGKQARNGMQLRVDEINEQGGIHGRKLKLLVEDSGYDPKKAVLAAQKLVNQDKIFIMAGHIGTAQNNAAMPVQFEKNVINFMPLTAAREMYEPFHRSSTPCSAPTTTRCACRARMVKEKNAKKVCTSTRTTSSAWRCCAAPKPA